MDDSFQLRANRLPGGGCHRQPAPLDHGLLSAVLAAQQAASPTARAQARARVDEPPRIGPDPLTELVLAGPAWRQAASAQSGCFNRIEVKRRLNIP